MTMVKISDLGAKDAFGLDDIPALVYFENGIPELYEDDLRNDQGICDSVILWLFSKVLENWVLV